MTDKPKHLGDLVQEYRELTEKIVEINKRRYVVAHELDERGIKVPALGHLRPEGIA
jgi:hypothetical protein